MYVIQVTITTTNTPQPIIARGPVINNSNTAFQSMYPQNQGSNNMYLGDAAMNSTNKAGLLLTSGGSFGGTQPIAQVSDLKEFWLLGTAGDVFVAMIFE